MIAYGEDEDYKPQFVLDDVTKDIKRHWLTHDLLLSIEQVKTMPWFIEIDVEDQVRLFFIKLNFWRSLHFYLSLCFRLKW